MWVLITTIIAVSSTGYPIGPSVSQQGQFSSPSFCQSAGNAWLASLQTLPNGTKPSVKVTDGIVATFACPEAQ